MRRTPWALVFQVSLVVFAMLFGAGNLMLPPKVGMIAGSMLLTGLAGFILSGVLLPLLGLLSIIDFDGDYNAFFGRLGRIPGALFIFFCILAIGPVIIMPRIVSLSYEMMSPFLPTMPEWFFAILFLSLVFVATFKPGRLLDIIGKFLSPVKIVSLLVIIIAGLFNGAPAVHVCESWWKLFKVGAEYGYGTLDLLGTIFFGSIIVKLLKGDHQHPMSGKQRTKVAAVASVCAAILLGLVYSGMCFLGAYHGQGLEHLNEGQLLSALSFRILGHYGAAIIGFTVFVACFTTTVALAAVTADYVYATICRIQVKYAQVLLGVLGVCLIPASMGLAAIMNFSMPIIKAMYPVLIVLTICNLLYKHTGFKMVKLPVLAIAIFMVFQTMHKLGVL